MINVKKKMLALLVCALGACALVFCLAGCGNSSSSSSGSSSGSSSSSSSSSSSKSSSSTSSNVKSSAEGQYASGTHHATVTVEGYDPFTITLDADAAPVTVSNFCELANQGFYNGKTFYRFVQGFCMQGGSTGNSASIVDDGLTPIVGEFSANSKTNALADDFKKGTVAMARSSDKDSATSTFFVTLSSDETTKSALDGKYAAFGTIDEAGMAVVDKIVEAYLPNVDDSSSGAISDESKQAKITGIVVDD